MNAKSIQLRPCRDDERSFCYEVKKAALRAYVEPIWGWVEGYPQNTR